jgi:hypothetical protein
MAAKLAGVRESTIGIRNHRPKFSSWYRWNDRTQIDGCRLPGIYVLANWQRAPTQAANPLSQNVIYIGETCSQSLSSRWRQFDRSARGGRGHSGGKTAFKQFGILGTDLFVAALPISHPREALRNAYIRFIERKLLLDYVLRWGNLPQCNQK